MENILRISKNKDSITTSDYIPLTTTWNRYALYSNNNTNTDQFYLGSTSNNNAVYVSDEISIKYDGGLATVTLVNPTMYKYNGSTVKQYINKKFFTFGQPTATVPNTYGVWNNDTSKNVYLLITASGNDVYMNLYYGPTNYEVVFEHYVFTLQITSVYSDNTTRYPQKEYVDEANLYDAGKWTVGYYYLISGSYSLSNKDLYGGVTYNHDINDTTDLSVGTVASAQIQFSTKKISKDFLDKYVWYWCNGTYMGMFIISNITKVGDRYTVIAYDCVSALDTYLNDWITSIQGEQETLYRWSRWTFSTTQDEYEFQIKTTKGDYTNKYVYMSDSLKYYASQNSLRFELDNPTKYPVSALWDLDLSNKYLYHEDTPNNIYFTGADNWGMTYHFDDSYWIYFEEAVLQTLTSSTPTDITNSQATRYPANARSGQYYYYRYHLVPAHYLPMSLTQFATDICDLCGLTLTGLGGVNTTMTVNDDIFNENNYTGRTLLQYVGQASGTYFIADESTATQTFRIKSDTYNTTNISLDNTDYVSLEQADYDCRVDTLWISTDDNNIGTEISTYTGNNEMDILHNPIFTMSTSGQFSTEAQNIFNTVTAYSPYVPMTFKTITSQGIKAGDIVSVDGNNTLIMGMKIDNTGFTFECTGNATRED